MEVAACAVVWTVRVARAVFTRARGGIDREVRGRWFRSRSAETATNEGRDPNSDRIGRTLRMRSMFTDFERLYRTSDFCRLGHPCTVQSTDEIRD